MTTVLKRRIFLTRFGQISSSCEYFCISVPDEGSS